MISQLGWQPDEPPSTTTKLKINFIKKEKNIYKRGGLGQNPPSVKKENENRKNHNLGKPVSRHTTTIHKEINL